MGQRRSFGSPPNSPVLLEHPEAIEGRRYGVASTSTVNELRLINRQASTAPEEVVSVGWESRV